MRLVSVDILRTIAIFLMVIVHFMENLSGAMWGPSGLGAPLFTFLVGLSYHAWSRSREAAGLSDEEISRGTIRRGLFLFTLGFAFNVAVWLPADIFNWDVLTLIGLSFLLLNIVRQLPWGVPVFMIVVAFVLAPMLRVFSDYPAYWTQGYFDCDPNAPEVILGFVVNGFFPVFPWILYPLAGYVTGTAFFDLEPEEHPPWRRTALLGAGLVILSFTLIRIGPWVTVSSGSSLLQGWTMFPASIEYVVGTVGMALLAFSMGHRWIDRNPRFNTNGRVATFARTFSRHSLSIYLLHHVVHLWPLWLVGAFTGAETTHLWRQAIPVGWAIFFSAICLAGSYALFRWMDRTGRRGIEGWMRAVCDRS